MAACILLYSLSCCALSRCPAPFLQVRVHERTHTGAKPYKCAFCDFRSAQGGNVRIHERRHTGDKRYPCPYCPFASVTSSATTTHIRRAHTKPETAGGPRPATGGHRRVAPVTVLRPDVLGV